MHFQWEILGIIPKRLERISSFDLDSEPEKIKLRKKSNREFSVQGRERDWAADRVLGERKGKPRCWPARWGSRRNWEPGKAERRARLCAHIFPFRLVPFECLRTMFLQLFPQPLRPASLPGHGPDFQRSPASPSRHSEPPQQDQPV